MTYEPTSSMQRLEAAGAREPGVARIALVQCHAVIGLALADPLARARIGYIVETTDLHRLRSRDPSPCADVLVLDATRLDGLHDAVAVLARAYGSAPIVALVELMRHRTALEALAAGVCGCVAADAPVDAIVHSIRTALNGDTFICRRVARVVAQRLQLDVDAPAAYTGPELTLREREVLALVALGWENAQIGRALHLSPATVKHHLSTLYAKLDVENRIQAAVRAVTEGLVEA
jgi:DNA-binding NarL/FixJ family response regulator